MLCWAERGSFEQGKGGEIDMGKRWRAGCVFPEIAILAELWDAHSDGFAGGLQR